MFERFQLRIVVMGIASLIAAIGLTATVVFAFLALYLWLAGITAPPLAALLTALVTLLGSVLVFFIAKAIVDASERARRKREEEAGVFGPAAMFGMAIGRQLLGLSEKNKRNMILGSLLAGFVVGISPRLRGALRDLVK